jgi:two-component system NtrC family response regulator
VAATNRNLENMVQAGLFRGDLLFRLRSFVIELPVLAERVDDIKLLVHYHADKICDYYDIPHKGFSPEFLRSLLLYRWPGNVRELINTLERTIAGARLEPILFPKHLPMQIRIEVTKMGMKKEMPHEDSCNHEVPHALPMLHDFRDSVYSQAEQQYLQDLMEISKNDIVEACRMSGLSQSRLYALLKKQGIPLQH